MCTFWFYLWFWLLLEKNLSSKHFENKNNKAKRKVILKQQAATAGRNYLKCLFCCVALMEFIQATNQFRPTIITMLVVYQYLHRNKTPQKHIDFVFQFISKCWECVGASNNLAKEFQKNMCKANKTKLIVPNYRRISYFGRLFRRLEYNEINKILRFFSFAFYFHHFFSPDLRFIKNILFRNKVCKKWTKNIFGPLNNKLRIVFIWKKPQKSKLCTRAKPKKYVECGGAIIIVVSGNICIWSPVRQHERQPHRAQQNMVFEYFNDYEVFTFWTYNVCNMHSRSWCMAVKN